MCSMYEPMLASQKDSEHGDICCTPPFRSSLYPNGFFRDASTKRLRQLRSSFSAAAGRDSAIMRVREQTICLCI